MEETTSNPADMDQHDTVLIVMQKQEAQQYITHLSDTYIDHKIKQLESNADYVLFEVARVVLGMEFKNKRFRNKSYLMVKLDKRSAHNVFTIDNDKKLFLIFSVRDAFSIDSDGESFVMRTPYLDMYKPLPLNSYLENRIFKLFLARKENRIICSGVEIYSPTYEERNLIQSRLARSRSHQPYLRWDKEEGKYFVDVLTPGEKLMSYDIIPITTRVKAACSSGAFDLCYSQLAIMAHRGYVAANLDKIEQAKAALAEHYKFITYSDINNYIDRWCDGFSTEKRQFLQSISARAAMIINYVYGRLVASKDYSHRELFNVMLMLAFRRYFQQKQAPLQEIEQEFNKLYRKKIRTNLNNYNVFRNFVTELYFSIKNNAKIPVYKETLDGLLLLGQLVDLDKLSQQRDAMKVSIDECIPTREEAERILKSLKRKKIVLEDYMMYTSQGPIFASPAVTAGNEAKLIRNILQEIDSSCNDAINDITHMIDFRTLEPVKIYAFGEGDSDQFIAGPYNVQLVLSSTSVECSVGITSFDTIMVKQRDEDQWDDYQLSLKMSIHPHATRNTMRYFLNHSKAEICLGETEPVLLKLAKSAKLLDCIFTALHMLQYAYLDDDWGNTAFLFPSLDMLKQPQTTES